MIRPLPHERLVVYQKAVALYEPVRQLVAGIRPPHAHLADQALRAISSVPLNIAEGATEFSRGDKARFYRMALRSAGEAAAALDVLRRSRLVNEARCGGIRVELVNVIAMLTGLVRTVKTQVVGLGVGALIGVGVGVGMGWEWWFNIPMPNHSHRHSPAR